jgi:hypothetical protein
VCKSSLLYPPRYGIYTPPPPFVRLSDAAMSSGREQADSAAPAEDTPSRPAGNADAASSASWLAGSADAATSALDNTSRHQVLAKASEFRSQRDVDKRQMHYVFLRLGLAFVVTGLVGGSVGLNFKSHENLPAAVVSVLFGQLPFVADIIILTLARSMDTDEFADRHPYCCLLAGVVMIVASVPYVVRFPHVGGLSVLNGAAIGLHRIFPAGMRPQISAQVILQCVLYFVNQTTDYLAVAVSGVVKGYNDVRALPLPNQKAYASTQSAVFGFSAALIGGWASWQAYRHLWTRGVAQELSCASAAVSEY